MHMRLLATAVAAVLLGACASPVPVAKNFDMTRQGVARSVQHWDVVAEDVVARTLEAMADTPQLQNRGVYVAAGRSTAFGTAFRDFMITHLVNEGATVRECKVGSERGPGFLGGARDVVVRYDTQVIVHSDYPTDYQPPRVTMLTAGVGVVREIAMAGHDAAAALTGAALVDWWTGFIAHPTRTELIVTTTIVEDNVFILRVKDIYYVPDGDARLFAQKVAKRSECPEDARPATAEEKAAETEMARQALVEREMLRVNPSWRPRWSSSF